MQLEELVQSPGLNKGIGHVRQLEQQPQVF